MQALQRMNTLLSPFLPSPRRSGASIRRPQIRLIRRYPNRKLYDVQNSRYVSLKALREMILSGESLKVVSTTDGRDLTRITIARLKLAEAEQAVRGLPETVANHLNQGVDGMMRRLQTLEQGIGQFRSTLVNPLAKWKR